MNASNEQTFGRVFEIEDMDLVDGDAPPPTQEVIREMATLTIT